MILGTRRETWDGEITISCAKTNVRCTLVYKEEVQDFIIHLVNRIRAGILRTTFMELYLKITKKFCTSKD